MPRLVRGIATLVSVAVLAAAVGCLGGAHNPGYFPNMIPGGPTVQTHAKPRGAAYFRDFDPQAVRLEVTPAQATAKPGGQQVFVATVYDKDGQPRRSRRVEWMIEGPGDIIEVDESGWTAGRGYKVSNKYAVSYTSFREHEITRGNTDPRDDTTLAAGQTFCVVSSAVPGETVVTAYAPGVFNWDKARVTAKVNWGDASEFTFPGSTSGRIGGSASLDTTIRKVAEREGVNPSDLRVRYRVTGAAAELVPPPGVAASRYGQDYLEIPPSSDGRAGVRVVQADSPKKAGRTDVSVEIWKPDPDGVNEGKVVGRRSVSVDWVAPQLKLEVIAPKVLAPGKEGTLTVVASNSGKVDSSAGQVKLHTDGFEVTPEQPPDGRYDDEPVWTLPALAPGEKKEYRMRVQAMKEGTLTAEATARADGLTPSARSVTEVGAAAMKLSTDPTLTASVGERVPVKVVVTNPGTVPLDTATAFATFSSGLEHDTGNGQVEATVGVVPPGESRTVTIPFIARQPGKQTVQVRVVADSLRDQQDVTINVMRPELKLSLRGPQRMSPGAKVQFQIGVTNAGDVAVPNVTVRLALPPGLTANEASDGGTISGGSAVTWRLGDVAVGAQPVLSVSVSADRTMDKAVLTAAATNGELANPDRKLGGGSSLSVKADANVTVQGQPALVLELADPQTPVPVGRRAAYRVVVRNRGTGPAKDVKATVYLPAEYGNARGVGANREEVKPEGNKLIFPVLKEIPANGTATFTVEVEGAKPGDARVRAEVLADYLSKPLSEEQSTRVTERR